MFSTILSPWETNWKAFGWNYYPCLIFPKVQAIILRRSWWCLKKEGKLTEIVIEHLCLFYISCKIETLVADTFQGKVLHLILHPHKCKAYFQFACQHNGLSSLCKDGIITKQKYQISKNFVLGWMKEIFILGLSSMPDQFLDLQKATNILWALV